MVELDAEKRWSLLLAKPLEIMTQAGRTKVRRKAHYEQIGEDFLEEAEMDFVVS